MALPRGRTRCPAARIDPALGSLTFGAVTDHYKAIIDAMPQRPVLIGHSIGGLRMQKLVNDGYAAAGSRSAPPRRKACSPSTGTFSKPTSLTPTPWPATSP
jgi:pimeloyl-ACP methyl ester carboxylesterase